MNASQTVTSTHRSAFGGLALVAFAGVASARGALLQLHVRPREVFRHPTNQLVQRNSRHEDEDHRAREQKMNRDEQKLIARLTAILNSSIENGLAARLLFPVGAKADTVPRALVTALSPQFEQTFPLTQQNYLTARSMGQTCRRPLH